MKAPFARPVALLMIALMLISAPQTWATCGGGGGGGTGGMSSGSRPVEQTYPVPWRLIKPEDPPSSAGLQVYWFPSSQQELEKSSLLYSRSLSLYASQCVTMGIVDARTPIGQKFGAGEKLPVAVLAQPDGTLVGKAENNNGYLRVDQVEKLVDSEMRRRQDALKEKMEDAKNKAKTGDNQTAIQEYRAVVEQKCMFPGKAKDAAKALKKLGVTDVGQLFDAPVFAPRQSVRIERTMRDGLKAENDARYTDAERLYSQAHQMDPADPTPLRYLGELYRHHIGDWDKARQTFDTVLAMPADPLSRAVALHGLGKMTISRRPVQEGFGTNGSLRPNLSSGPGLPQSGRLLELGRRHRAKADYYVHQTLALDPADAYNIVFAATFMAGNGHGDEALKIARQNEALLPASYNLAAVYAQAGQRERALALLQQRHFFQYERYQTVRAKEMMEARVDAVFVSLREDPAFLAITSAADGKLPVPMAKPASGSSAAN